jgi:hypothetical protein
MLKVYKLKTWPQAAKNPKQRVMQYKWTRYIAQVKMLYPITREHGGGCCHSI